MFKAATARKPSRPPLPPGRHAVGTGCAFVFGMTTPADALSDLSHASLTNELTAFFQRYAEDSLHGEPKAIAAAYAPSFFVAGPKGSQFFANDEKFLLWLDQLRSFNRQHAMQSMQPSRVEVHQLSPIHALARVTWATRFAKTGDRDIGFDISYLLERAGDSWKVLSYVSETDQEEEMKTLGLL